MAEVDLSYNSFSMLHALTLKLSLYFILFKFKLTENHIKSSFVKFIKKLHVQVDYNSDLVVSLTEMLSRAGSVGTPSHRGLLEE